jgi:hypothetical protein
VLIKASVYRGFFCQKCSKELFVEGLPMGFLPKKLLPVFRPSYALSLLQW